MDLAAKGLTTPRPGPGPGQVAGKEGKRGSEASAISDNKKAKPDVGLVDELRAELAKLSKERNDIEKERDDNDEMVTTLKQELEKAREAREAENGAAMGLRSKCERLVMENNDLEKRVQVLEHQNVTLMNNSVQKHFTEFLKKEGGIVNVDQYMLAKESEHVQLEDLALKSTNAFHMLTKQVEELKKETSHLKEKAAKNKESYKERVQVLEHENASLTNNSVQEHFTEFLKKEEGIVDVDLANLAFKSTNAFHKLTKQIQELKKETGYIKEEAAKNEESFKAKIKSLQDKLNASEARLEEMEEEVKVRLEQKDDNTQLQKLNVRVDKVQKELKEKENIIKTLTEKMQEGFARDEEEKRELEAKIEKANLEHKAEFLAWEEKTKRLKEELEKNEEHLDRGVLEIRSREEEIKAMKNKFRRLTKELNRPVEVINIY